MTSLITITDIQAVRPISSGLNTNRISMYIAEAQALDVAPSIGLTLLNDVITNPSTAPNILLTSGGTYTYNGKICECMGLKKAIAYYSYARILKNNPVNVTPFGVVEKSSDYSEPSQERNVAAAVRDAEGSGRFALQSCIDLINRNASNYPLADCLVAPRSNTPRFKIYGD